MNQLKVVLMLALLIAGVALGLLDRSENQKIAEGGGPVPRCPLYCK